MPPNLSEGSLLSSLGRPTESSKTAASRFSIDFFLLVGVGYANGFSLPSQLLAIGHNSHFGAFGLHMTAPSSIIA